jgi:colanic acid biosynthesis glycosyl transferase WcaI
VNDSPAAGSTPPTVLIVSQVYAPDPAATGQHIADVAEEWVRRGFRVVVYTSARGYDDCSRRYPPREQLRGVDVRRLRLSSFGKSSILVRLLAGGLFLLQSVVAGFFLRGVCTVLVSTSPPFAGMAGVLLSRLHRAPLIWWVMDLNPDQLIATGTLGEGSLLVRTFRWLNRVTVAQARDVIVLDHFMQSRLLRNIPGVSNIRVIPPWYHGAALATKADLAEDFRAAQGLTGQFVVMYSGNHALQHPLDTLLDAAKMLEATRDIVFVFIGGGLGKRAVEERIRSGATNLRSLPFRPLESIGASLSAADIHVVSMGDQVVGIVHPCKIYGVMAVGRPVLFFGPAASAAGELVAAHDFGRVVSHGDVAAAVEAILHLRSLRGTGLEAMGQRAAAIARSRFSQKVARNQVCDLVQYPHVGGAGDLRPENGGA